MLDEATHNDAGELNFLPEGYKPPSSTGGWLKPEAGETHKIRIMGTMKNPNEGVLCWEGWNQIDDGQGGTKRQPMRKPYTTEGYDTVHEYDEKGKPKHCWIIQVYHYDSDSAMIWAIPQRTIQEQLTVFTLDPDWGNPKNYDLKITRQGSGLETKWSIVTGNKKNEPSKAMKSILQEAKIDVSQVFAKDGYGDNPFGALMGESKDDLPF